MKELFYPHALWRRKLSTLFHHAVSGRSFNGLAFQSFVRGIVLVKIYGRMSIQRKSSKGRTLIVFDAGLDLGNGFVVEALIQHLPILAVGLEDCNLAGGTSFILHNQPVSIL